MTNIILFILSLPQLNNTIEIKITDNYYFSTQYLMNNIGSIENRIDVENLIKTIINKYTNAGFPFCRIYPEVIYANDEMEKIILKIDEGERIVMTDYLFDIQGKTEKNAVKRIADVRTGNYFSDKEVERVKKNLMRTDVFEDIKDNIVYQDDSYYLLFTLREKKSDYLTAWGTFGEDELNFSISFYSLNLLGTLRKLRFLYEYQRLFSLQFFEPILIFPATLEGSFSLWTYDSVRLVQFHAGITAPLSRYLKISLISGIESVSYYGDNSEPYSHTDNMLGAGFDLDYDASHWSCRQAINLEYLFRKHNRRRLRYDGRLYIKSFDIQPHYYAVRTDSFEYLDYYRIGGAKNLRGYFEEEFRVSDAMWLNIAYKRFFIFPVFDIGLLQNDVKFSYGFGIEAKSNLANTSLVIAWPKKGTWRDGKIHLMLEKGF